MPGWPPSIGCPLSNAPWRNRRCARLSNPGPIFPGEAMLLRSFSHARAHLSTAAAVLATALVLAATPALAQGADKSALATPDALAIKRILEQKFPGAEVRGVTKTPYFGLYEVQFDDRIVYTDAKAKYVVVGSVYDTESKINLTEDRQRRLNRVDLATLPLELAIK